MLESKKWLPNAWCGLAAALCFFSSCSNGKGDVAVPAATPYGYAGPPGGGVPQLGFQETTFRATPAGFDSTEVWTHGTGFAQGFPYIDPAGQCLGSGSGATNILPTVELDMLDILGRPMRNTTPSTAADPYHLQAKTPNAGEDPFGVVITAIDPTSPTSDLRRIFRMVKHEADTSGTINLGLLKLGLNILEGLPLFTDMTPGQAIEADDALELSDSAGALTRRYEGYSVLHYSNAAPKKTRSLARNSDGVWEATVKQIWYDSHIESDTAFIDVSAALNEEWVVSYEIQVLDDGEDDFAPFVMYLSRGVDAVELAEPNNRSADELAASPRAPHVAMDTTFYPMHVGNSYRLRLLHAEGKYYNLSYHWGWRVHPPRVQAMENAAKTWPGPQLVDPQSDEFVTDGNGDLVLTSKSLRDWELDVFGNPDTVGYDRRAVIEEKIGDLAPAKRMWHALLNAVGSGTPPSASTVSAEMVLAEAALLDWLDRTRLPAGVQVDPASDVTLIYLNNTIYGEWADGRELQRWMEYQTRSGAELTPSPGSFQIQQDSTIAITLLNGDRFPHGYLNVDFGGSRGWENFFGSTVGSGGSGAWFTFGRVRWWFNAGHGPQMDPATSTPGAKDRLFVRPVARPLGVEGPPGKHRITLHFNYDPPRRLRMYQFDPLHHDVAVFSLH